MLSAIFSNYFYLINQIPKDTLILIISLPILATICAFLRQIIGLRLFSLNLVLIFSYIFYFLRLEMGILLFLFILLSLTFLRLGIKGWRILYLSRIAILFSFIGLLFLALYLVSAYFKFGLLFIISPLPLIIIIILNEKFIANQIDDPRNAGIEIVEIFLIAISFYFILRWNFFQKLIINYSVFVLILSVIINIALGRWTGLRLTEYLRFREIFKYDKPLQKK